MKYQTKCAVLFALLAVVYSCKKNRDQSVADFAGNYAGTVIRQGVSQPDTFTFDTTANRREFLFYNAADSLYLTITVSGNSIVSITGGAPAFGGFSADTISGFGSLSGNVLQFTVFDAFTYNGVPIVDTLAFVANKR